MTMIRDLRLKLQKRFGYLKIADSNSLLPELARFFAFIDSEPLLSSATLEISSAYPKIPKEIQDALAVGQSAQGLGITGSTHLENATIGLVASRNVLADDHSRLPFLSYVGFQRKSFTEAGQLFVETYVRPYYEELDERIDFGDAVLAEANPRQTPDRMVPKEGVLRRLYQEPKRRKKAWFEALRNSLPAGNGIRNRTRLRHLEKLIW